MAEHQAWGSVLGEWRPVGLPGTLAEAQEIRDAMRGLGMDAEVRLHRRRRNTPDFGTSD